MSLYLRKMAEQHIEDSKSPSHILLTPDYYEREVLDAMTLGDKWGPGIQEEALGRLTVICADLLELARRADPAYGLISKDLDLYLTPDDGE